MVRTVALLTLLVWTADAAAQRPSGIEFDELLRATYELDGLWRPPTDGERCVQFSSYDRRSDAGPDDADAWYANADRGQFLRQLERDGRTEHVLVDVDGPGAVVRIWSANPGGRLFFYFDGETTPRYEVDFADLLSGRVDGLGEPWCGMRARGGNCHLPFPFARHLVVSSDASDFYYQVNVRHFAPETAVASFDPAWLVSHRAAIDAAGARLAPGGGPFAVGDDGQRVGFAAQVRAAGVAADGIVYARRFVGPGVLRGLRLRFRPFPGAEPRPEHDADLAATAALLARTLRALRLRVSVDGEVCVDVPVADFFGSAPGFRPWGGLAIGVRADGTAYCDFPMPCTDQLQVALIAEGGLPAATRVSGEFHFAPQPVAADALRFRASWHLEKDRSTRPFGDHTVLAAEGGPGRFVGTTLVVRNPTKAWWGEGDEKFVVDGETFPSTFGTGTEDYFGYAWCCPELFSHPLHAQPQADGPANFGYACNVRLHVADAVPFRRSMRFDLEVWHWQDVVVDYATVAYWYGAVGARSGLPAMASPAARAPVAMQLPFTFVVPDVAEGEALEVLERTGGRTSVQELDGFTGSRWSHDAHLWWIDGVPGDRLVLGLPVAAAGRYRVEGALTTARDYAIVRLRIAGHALGGDIDLYSPDVKSTGGIELGVADLEAGDARFEIEIVGCDERAVPRHMVGIDYLRLVPIR